MVDSNNNSISLHISRCQFLIGTLIAFTAAAFAKLPGLVSSAKAAITKKTSPIPYNTTININGKQHVLKLDSRTTLLDALRENIHLTGTKKGCDHGQCGAFPVMLVNH